MGIKFEKTTILISVKKQKNICLCTYQRPIARWCHSSRANWFSPKFASHFVCSNWLDHMAMQSLAEYPPIYLNKKVINSKIMKIEKLIRHFHCIRYGLFLLTSWLHTPFSVGLTAISMNSNRSNHHPSACCSYYYRRFSKSMGRTRAFGTKSSLWKKKLEFFN